MKLIFVRHAMTHFNEIQLTQGWCDSPLTETGIRQTQALAQKLQSYQIQKAYCSPTGRAKETINILLHDRQIIPHDDARLKEVYFGVLEGMPLAMREKLNIESPQWIFDHQMDYRPYQGEWIEDVISRHDDFFDDITKTADETILIVGHGCSLAAWLNSRMTLNKDAVFMKNSSAIIVDFNGQQLTFCQYLKGTDDE